MQNKYSTIAEKMLELSLLKVWHVFNRLEISFSPSHIFIVLMVVAVMALPSTDYQSAMKYLDAVGVFIATGSQGCISLGLSVPDTVFKSFESELSVALAVNHVEVCPFNIHSDLTTICQNNRFAVQAYSPLVQARRINHPTITESSEQ